MIDSNFADLYGTQQTTDPTVSNDSTQGYGVGSMWVNTTGIRIWRAMSVAVGAAVWILVSAPAAVYSVYNSAGNTTGFIASGAQIGAGAVAFAYFDLPATLGAGASVTLPTVANLVAAMTSPMVGQSYTLRVINRSSATFAWTVLTNTGWTLNGLMTVNQNTFRDFVVTLTSLSAATLQTVGIGTAP